MNNKNLQNTRFRTCAIGEQQSLEIFILYILWIIWSAGMFKVKCFRSRYSQRFHKEQAHTKFEHFEMLHFPLKVSQHLLKSYTLLSFILHLENIMSYKYNYRNQQIWLSSVELRWTAAFPRMILMSVVQSPTLRDHRRQDWTYCTPNTLKIPRDRYQLLSCTFILLMTLLVISYRYSNKLWKVEPHYWANLKPF